MEDHSNGGSLEPLEPADEGLDDDGAEGGDLVDVLEPAAPRFGTLEWLAQRPHVNVLGLELPDCHRVPAGATLAERNGRCRVIREDGEHCRARATRRYGLCIVHSGGGGAEDPAALGRLGQAARARLRSERVLLGIGPSGRADPRAVARLAALRRSTELASAIVDGPLDDPEISSISRQKAALAALEATFPLERATLEVDIPADGEGVSALGWSDLQALASHLLEGSSQSTD